MDANALNRSLLSLRKLLIDVFVRFFFDLFFLFFLFVFFCYFQRAYQRELFLVLQQRPLLRQVRPLHLLIVFVPQKQNSNE